jgi:hypothetical protein
MLCGELIESAVQQSVVCSAVILYTSMWSPTYYPVKSLSIIKINLSNNYRTNLSIN